MDPNAEAEKMAALKRAYADIILNTANESAARILASERRALRYQQSLFLAKEEALATMLRLKSLMDSKIKEAEMTSLNQVKRIQELEMQLSEAEQTIVSLKKELQRVNNVLKIGKNVSIDPFNEQNANGHTASDDGQCQESQPTPASNLHHSVAPGNLFTVDIMGTTTTTTTVQKNKDTNCSIGNVPQAESLKHLLAKRGCGSNSDLASIILRSKEPELIRNGCTQRIRAFEHNVPIPTVKVHNEKIDGQLPNFMNVSNVYENGKVERSHSIDSAKTVNTATRKAMNSFESEGHVQSSMATFRSFPTRKPRSRCIYVKTTDAPTSHNQNARCHQPSDSEGSMTKYGILATKSPSEEPPHKLIKSHSAPISSVCCKSEEDRTLGGDIISGREFSGLLPCNNRTAKEQFVVMQNQDDSWNEISQSFPYHTDNKDHANNVEDMTFAPTIETKDAIMWNETAHDNEVNLLKLDGSKLTVADQNIDENSDALHVKNDSLAVPSNSKASPACESGEVIPEVGKDKFLKYTFQRTRKKGSLNSNKESIAPVKISEKRKSGDNHNVLPDHPKPSLVTDFPRNDRRIVQVARQLISLSEKRW